ncbi:hypothetical protein MJO28_016564 [Puccinia striiformis f. sp. tritici]|uniref:Uncharacterized protein n=2 Tax=Puccinia striiformis f. sp. tritici TaxID=168172 RepID=A0A0L0VUV2_9BASI|nr:hypothetical protein Pst134EB_030890 [Puccinia striiformis f. sp. tritici]KAI7934810.1 hypothetical protein MJO29_016073 [Puccinia striiformis f. sp. tritici]KAI7935693.1 hypothetical protein MJO28_016564 [Puccinia striiformis f. sp. tritici]KNF03041.1 hypothetical protein PSTG_03634 [Puccinia striiformis f. sp. tritici PST-78]
MKSTLLAMVASILIAQVYGVIEEEVVYDARKYIIVKANDFPKELNTAAQRGNIREIACRNNEEFPVKICFNGEVRRLASKKTRFLTWDVEKRPWLVRTHHEDPILDHAIANEIIKQKEHRLSLQRDEPPIPVSYSSDDIEVA